MRGVGKKNVAPRDGFPPFPSHYVPGRHHLTAIFVRDYWEQKPYIMCELRATMSCHGLAVDHQRKVVKRTLGGGVVGHGGQTFTICGDFGLDFGLVLGVYVVPDTALSWAKAAMEEVVERYQDAGMDVPHFLYMDCACCSGKPEFRDLDTAAPLGPGPSTEGTGTSVAALWRSRFSVRLDVMHLMLRIGREMNAEHPRPINSVLDRTFYVQHSISTEIFDARWG